MEVADHIFIEAMRLFPRIRIVANGYVPTPPRRVLDAKLISHRCNDLTVPYPSGAISETDPFVDHETSPLDLELDDQACIVSHAPSGHAPDVSRSPGRAVQFRSKNVRDKHRLPPIFHLPVRWPFNYVRFASIWIGRDMLTVSLGSCWCRSSSPSF